ncbi:transporter substrate-binding domain-containing protein [Massilia sp. CCM 8733]|uniref:Transporter substrate-binding domain-containing protein n=1 Tax=Massilia mucilaginosa TaxID=2609282 RepID=A0ABX0P0M9_9BURK|nr:transporter substrate-binding domain-containing protein [Massilia mucilaginosa]NHZ92494.1 transporter substrate-binding domain-containing protein [Massilia mucilaginosa]
MDRHRFLILAFALSVMRAGAAAESGDIHVSTLVGSDPATSVAELVMGEAYRRIGRVLVVHKLPGERTLMMANEGRMDGELYRKVGMERDYPNLTIVPVPLLTYEIVIFTRGTDFVVNGWESLRPFTIGYVRGIKIVKENTAGMKTEAVPAMGQAFQKLAMGRTDVVVGNRLSGLAAAETLGIDDVRVLSPALASFPVYHYVNKKHAALVPALVAALQAMKADKTIDRLQKQGARGARP